MAEANRARYWDVVYRSARLPGCLDVGGEQVEVELVGLVWIQWAKAKSLPPSPRTGVERRDDDRAAGCLLVELDRGSKNMGRKCGPDSKASVAAIDREATEQQGRDRIGRPLGERVERS